MRKKVENVDKPNMQENFLDGQFILDTSEKASGNAYGTSGHEALKSESTNFWMPLKWWHANFSRKTKKWCESRKFLGKIT